jgi:hypothetical protein
MRKKNESKKRRRRMEERMKEERMKEVMQNLKSQFGTAFDPPNKITPEMTGLLIYEMTRQVAEAFS